MSKTIIFIHGRNFKPNKAALSRFWREATRFGIARSHPRKLNAFDGVKKIYAYYGNISNRYLRSIGREYEEVDDIADRRKALDGLRRHASHQFTKTRYNNLPGKTSLKEAFADALERLPAYLENPQAPFFLWLRQIVRWRILKVHRQHLGALGHVYCVVAVHHCANCVSYCLLYCVSSGLQHDTIGLLV